MFCVDKATNRNSEFLVVFLLILHADVFTWRPPSVDKTVCTVL